MPMTETIKMTYQELTESVAVEVMGWTPYDESDGGFHMDDGSYTDFDPEDYANHRDVISERMMDLNWEAIVVGRGDMWKAVFGKGKRLVGTDHNNAGIAVMIAAYEAVTGKRVEVTE